MWVHRCLSALVGISFMLAVASPLWAGHITNPSFETEDTSGWDETIPGGASISVVSSYDEPDGPKRSYSPVHGDWFALLKTDGAGSHTTLSQDVSLEAGDVLSGWAAFDANEVVPYNDAAAVRILDSSDGLVATPWSASVSTVGDYGSTPWQSWKWTATAADTYTLEYRVVNSGDSSNDSHAMFDHRVRGPSPSALVGLLSMAMTAVVVPLRRRLRGPTKTSGTLTPCPSPASGRGEFH